MILVNARFLSKNITGVERFAIEISRQIKNRLKNEVLFVAPKDIVQKEVAKELDAKVVGSNKGHLWEQYDLVNYLKKNNSPLLLNLTNTGPMFYKNSAVVLHDIAFIRYPETFSFAFRTFYKFLIPRLIKRSRFLFTVSEFSKREISDYYKISKNKIEVIYNSANSSFVPKKNSDSERYILGVSSLHKQKNFHSLVTAFNRLDIDKLKLYIVGSINKSFADNSLIEEINKNKNIKLLGRVEDKKLIELYSNASVFVFPSKYEGFGIPPLEAQACKTAVLSSNAASLPEVLGESALFFDPYSIDDLKEKLLKILDDEVLRKELVCKGAENIKRFSWEQSAEKLCKCLNI